MSSRGNPDTVTDTGPDAVNDVPVPVASKAAAPMVSAALKLEAPAVTVSDPDAMTSGLVDSTLWIITAEEITTWEPFPFVMMADWEGPGACPPIQFCGLDQENPSPLPFQMVVWAKLAVAKRKKRAAARNRRLIFISV